MGKTRLLKMGGPNLVKGQHTWVLVLKPVDKKGIRDVYFGQTVEADRIHDPESYVERGMGEFVDDAATPEAAPAPAK